ncbi:hypothetical protein LCGC14_0252530 [marine sediment metagenome]|uniref:Uncharacterized protein n=1 Tax=marine sediment metagenome TaxID=412755 RepID=A0A0F9WPR4_9ZZZZ
MLTIVEGPDGAGKSTLADDLAYRWIGVNRHHQGPYHQNVLTETLGAMSRNLYQQSHVLCDRLHLGERIYGPVFRQHDMLGDDGQRVLERALLGLGGVVQVVCYPPYDPHVRDAWLAREQLEMLDTLDQLEWVYRLYKTQGSMLPTTTYDWTRHTVERLCDDLVTIRSPGNHGPGVGWFEHTSVLLVGERANGINVNLPGPPLPFVSTNGCSAWLSEKLTGVDERWLYWVNALRPDGQPEDPSFIERLNPLGIIGLGKVAQDWLTSHGFEHEPMDHPQFAKRFHHGEPYPIKEAIDALRR